MSKLFIPIMLLVFSYVGNAQNDITNDLDKLQLFLSSLDERYVDSVETTKIVEKGMRSMLKELDPHSVYFTSDQYKAANEPLKGKFKGIGIRYQVIEDTLTVIEVLDKSPAEKGGLQIADQIIACGSDTLSGKDLSSRAMSNRIKDPENTDKPLVISRDGVLLFPILERDNVSVSSVPAYFMVTNSIGYIRLDRFSSTSLGDFRKALDDLKEQGITELVFDLRGNSGGYLNVAIRIVDEFLEDRRLIVYTEGTHQEKKEKYATTGGRFTDGDLVVLIDEKSASASEIVAGAIQDWDRGLVVGRRSYGKGLVQRTIEFQDGSAMRLTISRYYTPTGRSIQRPYSDGVEEYRKELSKRKEHGEFYVQDSMVIDTNMVYYTPSRRKVYGGGGIVPDVFIPADTGNPNPIWRQLNKSRLHYLFALKYSAKNEQLLAEKYPTIKDFTLGFELTEEEMLQVSNMLTNRGYVHEREDFESIKEDLSKNITSLIARFHYGFSDQYYYIQSSDKGVLKSIEVLETDYLSEIGLK